ncbi:HPF/RaiA family ribosome-associated protein [Ostreibacterium oceani]|uniref:HPF/RaiA family ribosome-associated protein n=1 Tax=Ostreibacterium oceani TaxID=2654998 RepID=A0A6N7EXA3_9GAMM|nr:HPF/RaiA family ribosome-associated protein [Ostreibacterium oceani]MPV86573.1 HPF/RaiA family ribosome-associated protein [Ostreibacterium oceani]
MQIQLNTDKNIEGTQGLEAFVAEEINQGLKHYAHRITRVEVHLSDQNADKGGNDDMQCKIEARIEGVQPVLVTSKSSTKEIALTESIDKMKSALSSIVGKMQHK